MNRISLKTITKIVSAIFLSVFLLFSQTTVLQTYAASTTGASMFQIDFIDVGQGDAALVQCDGHYMLVDGGDSKESSKIYAILKARSINYLDVMVATHPDADHIGGLSGALNYATIGTAYSPVTTHDTKTFQSFVKYLNLQGKTITVPQCGDSFALGSATVRVVGPIRASSDANNYSIVLRIEYGQTSFLLTGDAETDEEDSILNSGQNIQSTVLKVAHHGSAQSTGYHFLREVSPQFAVISVGSDNTYGHPTENVLSRLRDAGVKTYRTDLQGDISCTSDGRTVSFSTKKNADIDTLVGAGLGQNSNDGNSANSQDAGIANVSNDASQTEDIGVEASYVLNTNTHKFHVPTCNSVSQMKDKNKKFYTGNREDVMKQGYQPCKRCNP